MRIRSWVTLILFVPLALLVAANWSALTVPVRVDLFFFGVSWPLWPFAVVVPVTLTVVYLGAALLDRARTLRQVAALERQLESARAALDRGREAALDDVASRIEARLAALESVVEGSAGGVETRLADRLASLDAHLDRDAERHQQQLEAVVKRIGAVRDELAADVGEVEDVLVRELRALERSAPVDGEPGPTRPALTDGTA